MWPLPNGCSLSADAHLWHLATGMASLTFEADGLLPAGNAGDVSFGIKTSADGGWRLGVYAYTITDHTVTWGNNVTLDAYHNSESPSWLEFQLAPSIADADGTNSGA